MAAFFSNQLDFIFFFYGLAFILLGAVCLGIARGGPQSASWRFMAAFGFLHGAAEWLDLTAIIIGDTTTFAAARLTVMIVSFAVLLEFARMDAAQFGYRVPGRWIHGVLLLAALAGGSFDGIVGINAFARYGFALIGAGGVAAVLLRHSKGASAAEQRWIAGASACFGLYAIAAGVVVPETEFLPGRLVDHASFAALTGTPIQLVRGLLACSIAFTVWGMWSQRLAADIDSARYTTFMRRQLLRTLVAGPARRNPSGSRQRRRAARRICGDAILPGRDKRPGRLPIHV